METIYTDRSFYDDYGIKKEPYERSAHDQQQHPELTPLKPAVGLTAVGFSSQGLVAPHQFPSPYLPSADDLGYAYNYYHHAAPAHHGCHVGSAVQSVESSYGECVPYVNGSAPPSYLDVEGIACENDLEKIQEKIDYASVTLELPKDPQQWTAEQSHRWAEWTLGQYNLPSSNVTDFYMSGSLMCSLTQTDFQKKCSYYGDYLFAELDLWKNSFLVGTASSGSSSNISSSEDDDSCRDYEHLTSPSQSTFPASAAHPDAGRMYSAPLAGIPTPVITPVSQPNMSSQSLMSAAPSSTCWRDPMLMQAPLSQSRSVMASAGNMGRLMSPSSISPVPSSSSSAHLTWRDESHEDMNNLIGNSCEPPVGRGKHAIHLWQFLKELLLQPHQYHNCIRWLDRNKGIFKIEDSSRVALLWGRRKNRPAMNYDKLSRSIRQYYKKGIIKKTEHSKRLVYQFQPQYR